VQAVPTNVDQLAGHRVFVLIHRLAHGLIGAPDRGKEEYGEYRVEQPSASAVQLLTGADEHPHDQHQQGGGPHPFEGAVRWGAERQ